MGISAIIFGLAAYNIFIEIQTCIHWQAKAFALQAANGGVEEAWWTESPIMIGIQVWGKTAYEIISVLFGAVLNFTHMVMQWERR
jgi:hypothetical protein